MPNDLTPVPNPTNKKSGQITRIVLTNHEPPALFTPLGPEAQAVLVSNGTYRQALLYQRDNTLYTKVGSCFVKLMPHGETSKRKTYWREIIGPIWVASGAGLTLGGKL